MHVALVEEKLTTFKDSPPFRIARPVVPAFPNDLPSIRPNEEFCGRNIVLPFLYR